VEPEQLAERVWPGQRVSIEPLGGGITNRNFKVETEGQEFVLRRRQGHRAPGHRSHSRIRRLARRC
jgi:thiamine kinase-like enzyme